MSLVRLWAGRIYGTNTGNLFVEFEGEDAALEGKIHLNEPGVGMAVYAVKGSFDGNQLNLTGKPETQIEGVSFGDLNASATLNSRGELSGRWETGIGSAGTFILFPHDQSQAGEPSGGGVPAQFHTARHHFGAIQIDRAQVTALAEEIQHDFDSSSLVVTVVADTEQSRFLGDFKKTSFAMDRAAVLKLIVQDLEGGHVRRSVTVEFGPQVNMAMTQGIDEAWVLGMLEKLKRSIRPFERTYTTNFKKLGFGINQLLVVGVIVFLPSLRSLQDRFILMLVVLGLILCINWLHLRYLPYAAIYLVPKPKGLITSMGPTIISWVISVTAGLAATLMAAYLQGWFFPPQG